jgi:glycosyltransferase involved in cell wall biosynthesis
MKTDPSRRSFAFISSNTVQWGGSEELWAATAAELAADGHRVAVFKGRIDETQPRIRRLRDLSVSMTDLTRLPFLPAKVSSLIAIVAYPLITFHKAARLAFGLWRARPDLAIISQGGNWDGLFLARVCRRMKVPFVLIAQKAAEMYWPHDTRIARLRKVYAAARACFFVSERNRRLTEEQIGMRLPHASVVRNPFLVSWDERHDWPDESGGFRLACVGRLYPAEKGQDILLRVLARERWRNRPLSVTFFGSGAHRAALEQMAGLHELTSVRFAGFVDDVASVWDTHHALVVPSRCEGLPLVLVEAMLSGRVAIATDVAGHAEVIEDGESGFLAGAASEDALDEALERAWQRRSEWRAIGSAAASRIRTLVPSDPAAVMAATILGVVRRAEAATEVETVTAPVRERRPGWQRAVRARRIRRLKTAVRSRIGAVISSTFSR